MLTSRAAALNSAALCDPAPTSSCPAPSGATMRAAESKGVMSTSTPCSLKKPCSSAMNSPASVLAPRAPIRTFSTVAGGAAAGAAATGALGLVAAGAAGAAEAGGGAPDGAGGSAARPDPPHATTTMATAQSIPTLIAPPRCVIRGSTYEPAPARRCASFRRLLFTARRMSR